MTYPLDLSQLEKGAVPLLQVCLDLHMVCNGSADVIPASHVPQIMPYLKVRCQQWTPAPHTIDQPFDTAVYTLVQTAIADGDRWLAARDLDVAQHDEEHFHDDNLDHEHPADPTDLNWEQEPGCIIPNHCLVCGDHRQGDCYTAETIEAYEQAMREAESAAPTTHRFSSHAHPRGQHSSTGRAIAL